MNHHMNHQHMIIVPKPKRKFPCAVLLTAPPILLLMIRFVLLGYLLFYEHTFLFDDFLVSWNGGTKNGRSNICFWIYTCIPLFLYLLTATKNPGFLNECPSKFVRKKLTCNDEEMDCDVIKCTFRNRRHPDQNIFHDSNISPKEKSNSIDKSQTVPSVNFDKEFYTMKRKGLKEHEGYYLNNHSTDLSDSFSLSDSCIFSDSYSLSDINVVSYPDDSFCQKSSEINGPCSLNRRKINNYWIAEKGNLIDSNYLKNYNYKHSIRFNHIKKNSLTNSQSAGKCSFRLISVAKNIEKSKNIVSLYKIKKKKKKIVLQKKFIPCDEYNVNFKRNVLNHGNKSRRFCSLRASSNKINKLVFKKNKCRKSSHWNNTGLSTFMKRNRNKISVFSNVALRAFRKGDKSFKSLLNNNILCSCVPSYHSLQNRDFFCSVECSPESEKAFDKSFHDQTQQLHGSSHTTSKKSTCSRDSELSQASTISNGVFANCFSRLQRFLRHFLFCNAAERIKIHQSSNVKKDPETEADLILSNIFTQSRNKRGIMQFGKPLRFCKFCRMYQPLRTKHCSKCECCIRTFDHHCPWIGTCIGEGNRSYFFWYLIFEAVELSWVSWRFCSVLGGRGDISNRLFVELVWVGACLMVLLFLFLLVLSLLFYHLFLILSNLTTWENLSWNNITYLKNIEEDQGSPFSRTCWINLLVFCCPIRYWKISPKNRRFLCCPKKVNSFYVGKNSEVVWRPGRPSAPYVVSNACWSCRCE